MTRFVLDASYAMSWVTETERTPEALKNLDALGHQEAEAFVPAMWCDEITNVLLTMMRAKRLSHDRNLVALLDGLIDEVGQDETNPLASLMEVIGVLIEKYEDEHVPMLRPPAQT